MTTCGFDGGYAGLCKEPAEPGRFCPRHAAMRCISCGQSATQECSYEGQFVCGQPLCEDCEGWNDRSKDAGNWGFLNHSHRPRAQRQPGEAS